MCNKVYTSLKDDEKRTGQDLLTAEKMLLKKHPMRRKKQLLSEAECQQILDDATSGVLSLLSDDGYPYGVPLSHVRKGDKLYFHCAKTGHKLEAIKNSDKASFTVITQDKVVEEEYTTYFRSVIDFGRIRILTDDSEHRAAIEALAEKFAPDYPEGRNAEINKLYTAFLMLEMRIEHMTGKQAKELVKA